MQDEMFQQTRLPGIEPAFGDRERERLAALTREAVERYTQEELGGLEGQSERFQYLFRRLLRSVQAVVENVAQELLSGSFKPISFELGFGRKGELPPVELTVDGVTISVSGFVDRVDGWVRDGRLYLRVVDYKTGKKSFDWTEVWNGLGLQTLLYLFALERQGENLYKMPVESAGVLYLPAHEAVIQGSRTMDDDQWRRAGEAGYRFLPLRVSKTSGDVTGEALATAEQFGKLGRHIHRVLEEICRELGRGAIAADPFWRGPDKNACRYCDYAAACHFEEGRGGDCRRWAPKIAAADFWSEVSRDGADD